MISYPAYLLLANLRSCPYMLIAQILENPEIEVFYIVMDLEWVKWKICQRAFSKRLVDLIMPVRRVQSIDGRWMRMG